MKFKKLVALGLAAVMTLSLVACGGGEDKKPEGGEEGGSKSLTVYSNSTTNGQDVWLKEAAAEAGFDLTVVNVDGGGNLVSRLIAEKNNPQCDVVFGLNAVNYEQLKAEGVLQKYDAPSWTANVDMTLGDAEGYYYPIIVQPLFLVYNTDVVANPPAEWKDLVKPEYKDQYNMFTIGGGTAQMITSSILQQYQDPNGEYGVSEEGWELITAIYDNCHYQQDSDDYIGNLADGTVPMTELWGAGVIKFQKEKEMTFGRMQPEYGVPFVVEQLGITEGSKNVEAAKEFIEWFGGAEAMVGWSKNAGSIPANSEALAQVEDPAIKEMMEQTKAMDVDWGFVAENLADWVTKIELEILK